MSIKFFFIFSFGRTEAIRPSSFDAYEFVKFWASCNRKNNQIDLLNLFCKAINTHKTHINDVINFKSFDRHFLGLGLIALENKIEFPELFKDISFKKASHFHLSTSNTSSETDSVFCMGPYYNEDKLGYGCVYNIKDEKIIFSLTAFNSCNETSCNELGILIQESLIDCRNILLKK